MAVHIGVTAWAEARDDKDVIEVNRSFVDGVRSAGGVPFVLPVVDPDMAESMVASLDGIVLTGGIDIDPATYGADRHPSVTLIDGSRDRFEVALVAAALEAGRPVLGLCRGMQLLNVAGGGTLVQHLPDVTDQLHSEREHPHVVAHDVRVEPDSLLHEITGRQRTLGVNTLHHQAVDRLGNGLRPVAWSDDGVIEAIEADDGLRLGVQWHPELMLDHPHGHAELFDWVVTSARTRQGERSLA